MTPRFGRSGSRAAFALLCIASTMTLGGAAAGCVGSGDDNTVPNAPGDSGHDAAPDASVGDALGDARTREGGDATVQDGGTQEGGDVAVQVEAGHGIALFSSSTAIDFGAVGCGAAATRTLSVNNTGPAHLAVSATTTGTAFSVSPSILSVGPGASGTLTVNALVPGSAIAGTPLKGSLNVFTSDPSNANVAIPLSAIPTGAALALSWNGRTTGTSAKMSFASSEPATPAPPQMFSILNQGNAPATFAFVMPSDTRFSTSPDPSGGVMLSPGASWAATSWFTPKDTSAAIVTLAINTTGTTCGTSLSSIVLQGQGEVGVIQSWPTAPIEFGPAYCGGGAPAPQTISLVNTGAVDAHLIKLTVNAPNPGFAVAAAGRFIAANGQKIDITVTAPAIPSPAAGNPAIDLTAPIRATLAVQTDAETTPHTITLQEEPTGAILAFRTNHTSGFGTFPAVVLLGAPVSQGFGVQNTGNAPASVALVASMNGQADAGASVNVAAGSPPQAFSVATSPLLVDRAAEALDSVTFAPVVAGGVSGSIAMSVIPPVDGGTDAGPVTYLCGPLDNPVKLAGSGVGGGPSIGPTSLSFPAACGGGAPAAQSFIVSNNSSASLDLSWTMTGVVGPGAAQYVVSANPSSATATPQPGVLHPNESSTVTVTAAAVPPGVSDPASLSAQITISTDVPYDSPHAISLTEIPLGDQLSISAASLRFGQFPIHTSTLPETFTITNHANPGSPAANFSLTLQGLDTTAYAVATSTVSNLAPGGGVAAESATFTPTNAKAYPATLAITAAANPQCTPLPPPIQVSGTGTAGHVAVSATTLTFGTDPNDANGFVNCGATGPPHTFTVSNLGQVGNQAFNVTGVTLGNGATSAFGVSATSSNGAALPLLPPAGNNIPVAIGDTVTITVTPNAIPQNVPTPDDPTPFVDEVTVTTDAAGDTPHNVSLIMQARGAVITGAPPLTTNWNFGTVGFGSIGSITSAIKNTGNAPAAVALGGLSQSVFGLQNDPTPVPPHKVTSIVGQFVPSVANGAWSDQGKLVVTTPEAFCAVPPLPTQWISPTITLSGSSNSNPPLIVSRENLQFPTTNCGSGGPAARSVNITNQTNQAYAYSLSFHYGTYYSLTAITDAGTSIADAGTGVLPANPGSVTIVVTPLAVTPGQGVSPGSAPYADELVIHVATSPSATIFRVPISWTLNGAVLSLPQGAGPFRDGAGNAFYPADITSGFTLPMDNSGTGAATVDFAIQPPGALTFSPAPPISVLPGIRALLALSSASADAACPNTTIRGVTFLYSGPVCQPFQVPKVSVHSCNPTF